MGGRKHGFSEDPDGTVHRFKVDPKNLDRQMAEQRAAGRKPSVLDDDDLIRFGLMQQQAKKR